MYDLISSLCKSSFYHIRVIMRIRNCVDHNTAVTIAIFLVHSKLNYCNSLFISLPSSQLNGLQFIRNATARTVTRTPKVGIAAAAGTAAAAVVKQK
jgi:hypothetical protein